MEEFVKLIGVLAWPVLIGLALCGFRVPITRLMTGTAKFVKSMANRSLKIGNLEAGPPQQTPADAAATEQGLAPAASATPAEKPSGPVPVANYFATHVRDFASEVESNVEDYLPHIRQQYNIDREAALEYLVIDYLATVRLERASRHIFGSQLEAINQLNLHGGSLPLEILRWHYTNAATAAPDFYKNYSFEQWYGYLTSWLLIRIDGSDATIAPAGRAIFHYMQRWGYVSVQGY